MTPRVRAVELDVGRLEREASSVRHRVTSVHDQVHDDLFDLPRIGHDVAQPISRIKDHLDVLADEPAEHVLGVGHQRVQL